MFEQVFKDNFLKHGVHNYRKSDAVCSVVICVKVIFIPKH